MLICLQQLTCTCHLTFLNNKSYHVHITRLSPDGGGVTGDISKRDDILKISLRRPPENFKPCFYRLKQESKTRNTIFSKHFVTRCLEMKINSWSKSCRRAYIYSSDHFRRERYRRGEVNIIEYKLQFELISFLMQWELNMDFFSATEEPEN